MAPAILPALHQAFPRLQIIATGNRPELLEQTPAFQCFKLENKQLSSIQTEPQQFEEIYAQLYSEGSLLPAETDSQPSLLQEPPADMPTAESLLLQIQQQLDGEQQQELIRLLNGSGPSLSSGPLL